MTDIELLPLPDSHIVGQPCYFGSQMQDYARAVAEHNVRFLTHELANAECAIDAEQAGRKKAEARAERLAEALRLIATPQRSDGTWNRDREACRQIAEEALRDHDQEGKGG